MQSVSRQRARLRTSPETKSGVVRTSLPLQRRFSFLGRCRVTNSMGAVPGMRAARGLFGKRAIHWFPNWWECSEMADFIGLFFGSPLLRRDAARERAWRLRSSRSQKHCNHIRRKIPTDTNAVKGNRPLVSNLNDLIFIREGEKKWPP